MSKLVKGNRVNIALFVVLVVLGVAVFVTKSKVTTSEKTARENNVLSAFRDDDVVGIAFERDGKKFALSRTKLDDAGDSTWNLTEPVKEEADAYGIDKLLGSLEYARVVRRIKPAEVDRAAFGLDGPRWILSVDMGKIRYTLRLGKEAASPAGAAYLELIADGAPGGGVMIVPRDLVTELDLNADELRGRQMLPYTSNLLRSIRIVGTDGQERKLKAAGKDRWRFDGMLGDVRVSRDDFDQVLTQFARTKAEHFIDLSSAEAGLASGPRVKITVVPSDDKRPKAVVEVGGACPKSENDLVAIRREPDPIAACVPKSVMAGLDMPADQLIDRALFALRKDEVESLRISRGEKKLDLDRKESGFVMRAPAKGDVDLEIGNQRIESIVRARGKRLESPDLKALGLDPPAGRVTVKSSGESDAAVVEETIELGERAKDGKLAARRIVDGSVIELDAESARALEPDSTLIRSRKIFDFGPSEFRTVEITGKSVSQKLHREPSGAFTLESPKGFDHDAALATTIVDELGRLTAERWIADQDDGSFGLAAPRLKVKVSFEIGDAGVKEQTLLVGGPASAGAYAKLEGEPGVFIAPKKAVEALETWVIDCSPFMLTPDVASRVELEHQGKKIVLVRDGDRFVPAPGSPTSASLAGLVETLLALRAEAAIHTGAARPGEGFEKPELIVRTEPNGDAKKKVFRIGAGDSWQGTSIHYARAEGVDATYVIAKSKVRALLDAF